MVRLVADTRLPVETQRIQSDVFTRADSTSNLGSTTEGAAWTQSGGTWGISSNKAYLSAQSGGSQNIAYVDFGSGYFTTLESDITIPSGGNAGLCFRVIDANNFISARISETSQNLLLFKIVASSVTNLATFSTTITAGSTYSLKLRCESAYIHVYLNSRPVVQYEMTGTDQSQFADTVTLVGMRAANPSTITDLRFDNFVCKHPDTTFTRSSSW